MNLNYYAKYLKYKNKYMMKRKAEDTPASETKVDYSSKYTADTLPPALEIEDEEDEEDEEDDEDEEEEEEGGAATATSKKKSTKAKEGKKNRERETKDAQDYAVKFKNYIEEKSINKEQWKSYTNDEKMFQVNRFFTEKEVTNPIHQGYIESVIKFTSITTPMTVQEYQASDKARNKSFSKYLTAFVRENEILEKPPSPTRTVKMKAAEADVIAENYLLLKENGLFSRKDGNLTKFLAENKISDTTLRDAVKRVEEKREAERATQLLTDLRSTAHVASATVASATTSYPPNPNPNP